jgi:hypothetical protein
MVVGGGNGTVVMESSGADGGSSGGGQAKQACSTRAWRQTATEGVGFDALLRC